MKTCKCLLFVILFISNLSAAIFAQEIRTTSLKGSVNNSLGRKLEGASLLLYKSKDSVQIKSIISDSSGHYEFLKLDETDYFIRVIYVGMKTYSSPILTLKSEPVFHHIRLEENANELNTVRISATPSFIQQQLGKVVLNIAGNPASEGSSAFELLEKAPGITIDQQGAISMRGRQGVTIMINGKVQQLSGTELTEMLRGISGTNIQQIELVHNPSARHEAAGSAGIIDIRMRKPTDAGINGNLNLSAGQGEFFKSINGGNINLGIGGLNLFGNYSLASRGDYVKIDMERTYHGAALPLSGFLQNLKQEISYQSHTSRLGADYAISNKTTVGAEWFGNFIHINRNTNSKNKHLGNSVVLQFENTLSDVVNGRTNYGANINLMHKMDTAGTSLTIDADYARFLLDDIQDYDIRYLNPDFQEVKTPYLLYNDAAGDLNIKAISINFNKKIQQSVEFAAGIKSSYTNSGTALDFFDRSNQENVLDQQLSNQFDYKEDVQSAYLNLSQKGTTMDFQFGLRAEYTKVSSNALKADSRFEKQYFQLFPSAAIRMNINEVHSIGASFSRRISRPSYNQLNPFFYFLDLSTRFSGNSKLDPSLSNSAELNYTWKGKYIFSIGYFNSNAPILDVQIRDPENASSLIQTPVNLRKQTDYTLMMNIPITISDWFSSSNNLSYNYVIFKGSVQSEEIATQKPYLYFNTNNSFKLADWSLQLSGTYNGSRYQGNVKAEAVVYTSVAVQKKIGKRAILGFNMGDIFHSNTIRSKNALSTYDNKLYWRRDSRFGVLNVTYRFGGKDNSGKRKTGAAEEEKRRAGN